MMHSQWAAARSSFARGEQAANKNAIIDRGVSASYHARAWDDSKLVRANERSIARLATARYPRAIYLFYFIFLVYLVTLPHCPLPLLNPADADFAEHIPSAPYYEFDNSTKVYDDSIRKKDYYVRSARN